MKFKPNAPATSCKNGVRLSVQASRYHYCSPREDGGPYSSVEVGFIALDSKPYPAPESWLPYADNSGKGTLSDVFGYVPVELVEEFIAQNGGRA
jgi:hypothetical protein